jgi:hypothetical protein
MWQLVWADYSLKIILVAVTCPCAAQRHAEVNSLVTAKRASEYELPRRNASAKSVHHPSLFVVVSLP